MSGCHVRLRSGFRGTWPWCSSSTWTGLLSSEEVGGQQLDEGCRLEVGEIVIVEEDESNIDIVDKNKNIESEDVGEEIVGSVAVRVRRKGGVSREGVGVREDFSLLLVGFLTFCLFCDFLSILYVVYVRVHD